MRPDELTSLINTVAQNGLRYFQYKLGDEQVVIYGQSPDRDDRQERDDCPAENAEPEGAAEISGPTGMELFLQGEKEGMKKSPKAEEDGGSIAVKAPMVGTAILKNMKTGGNYISEGGRVKKGQTVFAVKAMNLVTDITAPVAGTVEQICIEDNQDVEFGTVVLKIDKEEKQYVFKNFDCGQGRGGCQNHPGMPGIEYLHGRRLFGGRQDEPPCRPGR